MHIQRVDGVGVGEGGKGSGGGGRAHRKSITGSGWGGAGGGGGEKSGAGGGDPRAMGKYQGLLGTPEGVGVFLGGGPLLQHAQQAAVVQEAL